MTLFYFQLFCSPGALSQRSFSAFGAVSEQQLAFKPLGIATGKVTPSITEVVVIAPEPPILRSYELKSNGRLGQSGTIGSVRSAKSVVVADLTNDGVSEYVSLSLDGNLLTLIHHDGLKYKSHEVPLQRSEQHFLVADINNDKRKDILFFGKSNAGITTLLCQSNGKFKVGPILFPEISVSDLLAQDLNSDGITDLLMLNWLSNDLTVGYQISRLVFSELVSVPLNSEPTSITIARSPTEKSFRVAIALPDLQEVQVYTGNALGDYRLNQSIKCTSSPRSAKFTFVNSDDWQDLVVIADDGLAVSLAATSSTFSPIMVFGLAQSIAGYSLEDLDGDGKQDCVFVDNGTNRLVALANSEYTGGVEWPYEYAVGFDPGGLVVEDLNGDGKQDIAVINRESATFSLLLGKGKGRFRGQQTLALPARPASIRVSSGLSHNERTVLISHARTDEVSVINISDDVSRSRAYSVPTGSEPHVVAANVDSSTLRFVVRYRNMKDRSYILSAFEQISSRQFVEHSLRSTLPTRIVTMKVDDGVRVGTYDLLFATNDKSTKTTTVSISTSEAGIQFKTAKPLFSYADSGSTTRFLDAGYLNSDPFKDVLVVLGPPRNEMGIWYGRPQNVTRDSIEWIRNVQPAGDDAILIRDVNDDKFADVTWLDQLRKAVLTMYGSEKRGFRSPAVVVSGDAISSLRIGSFFDQRQHDLVITNADRGTVTILMNPFSR